MKAAKAAKKSLDFSNIKNANFFPVMKQKIQRNSTACFVSAPFMLWVSVAAVISAMKMKRA